MSACSVSRLTKVPPDIAEALESLRTFWEQTEREARASGQRVREHFEHALKTSSAPRLAMGRYGLLLDTSGRMLRSLGVPAERTEALLPGEERQPVLWLLSPAVVLLCAQDGRVMMLEPPYVLLGAEPPERARVRAVPPDREALRMYAWLDRVWPGSFSLTHDLLGRFQSSSTLLGILSECAAGRLNVRQAEELKDLWHALETGANPGTRDLTPLYERMCWRAQYEKFDLEFFREQLGPRMKADLARFEEQRAEEEERAIREGSQGY